MSEVNNHIIKLISLYTSKEITETAYKELEKWIDESPENKALFADYLLFYKKTRQLSFTDSIDKNKAWNSIISKLETPFEPNILQKKSKVFSFNNRFFKYAAAAVLVGIIATTYLFKDTFLNIPIDKNQEVIVAIPHQIEAGTDKATLTLENGTNVLLENGTTFQTQNASSNGREIVYKSNEQKPTKIAYNYLTIPRGGQFFIKLSDGTEVWLNSESQLKYPVAFVDGENREVELVYGEAYFDVSPSSKHKGSKFRVMNKSQEVEVLGTKFNIKAYQNENSVFTTLVEGKVAVNTFDKKQQLLPNQQLHLNIKTNTSTIKTVDVNDEISWKDGVFSFKRKSLEDIMKVISRWYDLDVQFINPEIKNAGFNGIIDKNQKIEDILETIKNYGILKEYEIKNKTVILK